MNIINKIACTNHSDTVHHIFFFRDGRIQSLTLATLEQQATAVAVHLRSLGVCRGDRVGVMAKNCIEWVLIDLATLKLGAVLAGFEVGRYDATTLKTQYDLKLLLLDQKVGTDPYTINLASVREWSEASIPAISLFHNGYQDDDVLAIKFTSGSTGLPKGLEASVGSVNDSINAVQDMFNHSSIDNLLVFLPLSLLQQRYWIYSALVYGHDVTITMLDRVFITTQQVQPTVIMGVPGFFDSVKTQIERTANSKTLKERREAILALLGNKIRYLWTGSAPCNPSTLNFFNDCGVSLFEGYGMNETCIVSKNYPGAFKTGSVGKVLPNKTVRFNEQGVLIVGSRHPVNNRYTWCNLGDNEKMFLESGEVVTGDLAYLDEDNYLYILGRADDVLALSNGRKINVRPIEENIKSHSDIHECVLYGSGKPYLIALISPTNRNVEKNSIETHLNTVNKNLSKEQQIGGFILAKERFALENNLLTSQFKPKRKEIYHSYSQEIEELYRGR